ncbi:hypothetical protein DSECCO2_544270 [anaerobic digester metagenome]
MNVERINAIATICGCIVFNNVCVADILIAAPFHSVTNDGVECFSKIIGRMNSQIEIIGAVAAAFGQI